MGELAINNLVKIILGILVVVAVITALYFIFGNKIIEFFKTDLAGESFEAILILIK